MLSINVVTLCCFMKLPESACLRIIHSHGLIGIVYTPLYLVFTLPYTPLHMRQTAATVLQQVKHPVFLGSNIIDTLQILRNTEPLIPVSAQFATVMCFTTENYF